MDGYEQTPDRILREMSFIPSAWFPLVNNILHRNLAVNHNTKYSENVGVIPMITNSDEIVVVNLSTIYGNDVALVLTYRFMRTIDEET